MHNADMGDYDKDISEALKAFWGSRDAQAAKQKGTGKQDAGTRGSVTGGQHLNAVSDLVEQVTSSAIAQGVSIHSGGGNRNPLTAIPGWYRPTKQWDIVYRLDDEPIAVVELKSQVGSFGNNANNRAAEAVGNAADLMAAQRNGQLVSPLWRGYIFVIEDCDDSRKASTLGSDDRWSMDPEFAQASYIDRVNMLCRRLVEEGLYDGAWAVATRRPPNFGWKEPDSAITGFNRFANGLRNFLRAP